MPCGGRSLELRGKFTAIRRQHRAPASRRFNGSYSVQEILRMKNVRIIATIVLVCFSVVQAVLVYAVWIKKRTVEARLKETLTAATNSQSALKTKEETIELLEGKVNRLVQVLTNSTAQLRTAQEAIRAIELAREENRKQEEAAARIVAEVPAPTITVETDRAGKQVKKFLFPKVMSAGGNVLATNAAFGKLVGRRLSFWPETGPIALDVERVHPAILRYLEIDPEGAKQIQVRMDASWRAQQAADHQRMLAEQKFQQERWEAQELVRVEQEKANAEIAKNRAQERATLETAYNERLKAQAAARMADAAMIDAMTPAPSTIIQNVNRNTLFGY